MVTWGLKAEGGFHSPSAVPSRSICTGAERVASRFSCSWHVWEEEHSHLTFTFALSSALMENIEAGEEQRTLLSVLCIQGQGRRRRRQRIRMLEFQDPLVSLLTKKSSLAFLILWWGREHLSSLLVHSFMHSSCLFTEPCMSQAVLLPRIK